MLVNISTPNRFVERPFTRSGPIENPQVPNKQFGVIYTSSPNASPDDFDVNDLLGSSLRGADQADIESNYFTILGGYFCEKGNGVVTISQLFGLALSTADGFNLSSGDHMLGDEWERADLSGPNRKGFLDERNLGNTGWTLIVSHKPFEHQYPRSNRDIIIRRLCPELGPLTLVETQRDEVSIEIKAEVQVSNGPVAFFHWDFGDGQTETTTVAQVLHRYERNPTQDQTYTIRLQTEGVGKSCVAQSEGTFEVDQACPVLAIEEVKQLGISAQEWELGVKLVPSSPQADRYRWDWGDGSPLETTTELELSHRYARSFSGQSDFVISIRSDGPGSCQGLVQYELRVPPPPCPRIAGLEIVQQDLQDDALLVTVEAQVKEGSIPSFEWDWGDGSPVEQTNIPKHTHRFTRPDGTPEDFEISVTGLGPSTCQSTAKVPLRVAGRCPEWVSTEVELTELNDQTATFEISLEFVGPLPDQITWEWGSGSQTTAEPRLILTLPRPAGANETQTINIQTKGPGPCELHLSQEVHVPGVCPALVGVDVDIIKVEGNHQELKLSVLFNGPEPDQFEWNFADGSPIQTSDSPHITHRFEGRYGEKIPISIQVKGKGPDQCEASLVHTHFIEIPCQTELGLRFSQKKPQGLTQVVDFQVDVKGPQPDKFIWDLGDGGAPISSQDPVLSHQFDLELGQSQLKQVKVTGIGPHACSSSAEVDVMMAKICAEPFDLKIELGDATDQSQDVIARVNFRPGKPEKFLWDWGDGSQASITTEPEARHTYIRTLGENKSFVVKITALGPGDCGLSTHTDSHVPLSCPRLGKLNITPTKDEADSLTFEFNLEVLDEGEYIPGFIWDWGDGSTPTRTTAPKAEHVFNKSKGKEVRFPVKVIALGPGDCRPEAGVQVPVLAGEVCPKLLRIDLTVSDSTPSEQTIALAPILTGGSATTYFWDFGDGIGILETTDPVIYQAFPRLETAKEYAVKLRTEGPGDCRDQGEVRVKIPPKEEACPEIMQIKLKSSHPDGDHYWLVELAAEINGPTPDEFQWSHPGLDQPLVTKGSQTSLLFSRSSDKDESILVQVKATGPGDCQTDAKTTVKVPQLDKEPSFFCRIWPYLLAFLTSLTVGAILIATVGLGLGLASPGKSGGVVALLVGSLLLFLGVYLIGRYKTRCPLGRCNSLAIGWSASLGGLMVSWFLLNCFNWIPVAIGFFVLLGLLAFFWFRDCAPESKAQKFFIFLAAGAAAGAINMWLFAHPFLSCC